MKIAKITERKIVTFFRKAKGKKLPKDIISESATTSEVAPESATTSEVAPERSMPKDNKTKGKLSKKARSRLKKALTLVIEAHNHKAKKDKKPKELAKKNLTFITLTLCSPQKNDDKYIKRYMLDPFLQFLKDECFVTCYVWRAEPQKNGNIHFHVLANRYIYWQIIRAKWNSFLRKEDYIQPYKEKYSNMSLAEYINERKPKDKDAKIAVTKAYNNGVASNWEDPNSTDIHQMHKINNTIAYMSKYMSKDSTEEDRAIEGHVWGKSENIERAEILEIEKIPYELDVYIRNIKSNKDNFVIEKEYWAMYYLKNTDYTTYPKVVRELYEAQQEANYLILC